jgi:3-oxoacyl-[acyl-carrier protein] reductase
MSRLRVLVTGGGRGIGRAIAHRWAREGARVVVCARTAVELERVAAEVDELGGEGSAVVMDLADPDSIRAGLARALARLEGLDLLVNNAGIFKVAPLAELPLEQWESMLRINLTGPFVLTQAALPALLESRGCILNVSSAAGKQGYPGSSGYCASKYGLRGMGDALREEVRDAGVRVLTLYPGGTDTSIFDDVPGEWDRSTMNSTEEVADVAWAAVNSGGDQVDWDVPPPVR